MKVKISQFTCGGHGVIIDCCNPRILCPFCKEYIVDSALSYEKEVTPQELYHLIDQNRFIISTKL
jgi:hypothetical protein